MSKIELIPVDMIGSYEDRHSLKAMFEQVQASANEKQRSFPKHCIAGSKPKK